MTTARQLKKILEEIPEHLQDVDIILTNPYAFYKNVDIKLFPIKTRITLTDLNAVEIVINDWGESWYSMLDFEKRK